MREGECGRAGHLAGQLYCGEQDDGAAKAFGVSKSTVHKDVSDRLKKLNPALCREVKKVLEINKQERHIRGGLATRHKYQVLKEEE